MKLYLAFILTVIVSITALHAKSSDISINTNHSDNFAKPSKESVQIEVERGSDSLTVSQFKRKDKSLAQQGNYLAKLRVNVLGNTKPHTVGSKPKRNGALFKAIYFGRLKNGFSERRLVSKRWNPENLLLEGLRKLGVIVWGAGWGAALAFYLTAIFINILALWLVGTLFLIAGSLGCALFFLDIYLAES